MRRRIAVALVVGLVAAGAFTWWRTHAGGGIRYTGFVEGEERVLRSEVSGRVLEVRFAEGETVPAGGVVARIDDAEIASRIASRRQELAVLDAQIVRQEQEVALTERTWRQDLAARGSELRQAEAAAELAVRTHERQVALVEQGVATAQRLDETRANRDQTRSGVDRAREMLARARAEEGRIEVARRQLAVLREERALAGARLAELEVLHAKYEIRAPDTSTVVQAQLLWAGELAQPGTPVLSVLDPRDKFVQIYVPVTESGRVRVGTPVEIELDSAPGRRVPGEVSFVADQANFTPEKIETRSDRVGQVYRAKVRILAEVERFQPGTEGNVYVLDGQPVQAARKEP